MRELSLFSGAGGGLQGSLLLGWEPVGYVEWNEYYQRVIAQRITDGILPVAPIFGDVRAFINEGYARAYQGMVDVLSGGFPCQPFSQAGKRLGANDPRNMWPATAECVRIIRPRFCFFENVPGLLNSGYFGTVVADLAACGYGVRWGVLSACAFGAPHTRERLFILAYPNAQRCQGWGKRKGSPPSSERRATQEWIQNPTQGRRPIRSQIWDTAETDILGVADGLGAKVERIGAAGNGQVPAVVRAAWHLLTKGLDL